MGKDATLSISERLNQNNTGFRPCTMKGKNIDKMKTVLKIVGYNKNTQAWDTVASNPTAPAKLYFDGAGVFRETLCATKNAEKLLKGVDLSKYFCLQMYVDGVRIAASKCNLNRIKWDFVKAGGLF